MAEIALVASIFSVAAFGSSVATKLYETADVMIHARQEISKLAKHVVQFTYVLKHLGHVLEAEKGNCSKEVLRDLRKIKHSCKSTFREINSTVRAKRLQSKDDSKGISELMEEVRLLKLIIIENHDNSTRLRNAEISNNVEAMHAPQTSYENFGDCTEPYSAHGPFPPGQISPVERSPSSTSVVSISDDEDLERDHNTNYNKDVDQKEQGNDLQGQDIMGLNRWSPPQPEMSTSCAPTTNIHRESDLLLQMVPYRPYSISIPSQNLISGVPDPHKPMISDVQNTTDIIRLLLNKWTISGSPPVSEVLNEEAARESKERQAQKAAAQTRNRFPQRQPPSPGAVSYDSDINSVYGQEGSNMPPWSLHRPQQWFPTKTNRKEFWRSHASIGVSRNLGDHLLAALRSSRGGIYYKKRNYHKQVHYVDQTPLFECEFVPSYMIPLGESGPFRTELGKGLVRREALQLLGYSFEDEDTGQYLVMGDLKFAEIEELVKLSFQALDRILEDQSKQIIKEKGLYEGVNIARYQNLPAQRTMTSDFLPSFQGPWDQQRPPYAPPTTLYPAHSAIFDLPPRTVRSRARPPRHYSPKQTKSGDREVESSGLQLNQIENYQQQVQSTAPQEVRFTLPRLESSTRAAKKDENIAHNSTKSNSTPSRMTQDKLHTLQARLEETKKKMEEAEKNGNIAKAADLKFYAIPDIQYQIDELAKVEREESAKKTNSTVRAGESSKAESKGPQPADVETESEGSGDESSDTGDGEDDETMDLYE
ncbi:MAG: hypothetical protein Q9167_007594 [Letrouitia subvulpina]